MAANAAEELAYWSSQPGAAGVKLHLGNSQFDFASDEQMEKLAVFFRAARAVKMPLIVHSRTDEGFTPQNYADLSTPCFLRPAICRFSSHMAAVMAGWTRQR